MLSGVLLRMIPDDDNLWGNYLNPVERTVSKTKGCRPDPRVNSRGADRCPTVSLGPGWIPREPEDITCGDSLDSGLMQGSNTGQSSHKHTLPARPDWDTYFLGIATAVAARADCTRRKVGAVIITPDKRIVSTGYNGAPTGGPSCLKGECPRASSGVPGLSSYDTGPGACIALHAEANALLYADRADRIGSTLYITCEPCDGCMRLIKGSGISRIVHAGNGTEPVVILLS